LDGVTKRFQAVDDATGDVLLSALVEVVRTEVRVLCAVGQKVIGDGRMV
jgi:class 3 adenylate cyclase